MKHKRTPPEIDWFGHVADFIGQVLLACATAYAGATLLKWAWVAWCLSNQLVLPFAKGPNDPLNISATWVFNGTFVLIALVTIWRMRRKTRPEAEATRQVKEKDMHSEAHRKLRRFAAFLGQLLVAFVVAGACAEWVGRVYVRWYAYDMGVPLHELSDDYSMAFGAVLLRIKVLLVVALLLLWKLRTNQSSR